MDLLVVLLIAGVIDTESNRERETVIDTASVVEIESVSERETT
jgi:hypothetical protein